MWLTPELSTTMLSKNDYIPRLKLSGFRFSQEPGFRRQWVRAMNRGQFIQAEDSKVNTANALFLSITQ